MTSMKFARSRALDGKCHSVIPGGAHTYAKGDDQYPENAPGYIVRGQGCRVWDLDGNEFIEYGMGLRAVTLGHAYRPVVEAAYKQMLLGTNFTRPSVLELQCAEQLLGLIEGAEMVKFAKNGSDATTAAVKLARAYTGREIIAICGDQPFFSTDDWFIGHTPMASGIPHAIRNLTVKFQYNDIDSLNTLFEEQHGKIACVILEAATVVEPQDNFLQQVQKLCKKNGALLVFDEMITGFRWHLGGAQKSYGVTPDLSTFGKALGNGLSISALVGKREIMRLGGLHHDQKRVFLLSTTHGAETHCLAAAMEVMRIYEKEQVIDFLYEQGTRLTNGIRQVTEELRLSEYFQVAGRPCNLIYITRDQDKNSSQAFRTLFLQEIIKRGLLAPSFVVSFSHTDKDIDRTVEQGAEALAVYKRALNEGVDKYLVGRPVKPVFRKFN
jgi:glutamate-1-semialdehyde 2,1-aminomutase